MAGKPRRQHLTDGAVIHPAQPHQTPAGRYATLLPLTLLFTAIFYGGNVCRTLVANGSLPAIPGVWLVPLAMLIGLAFCIARDFSLLRKFSR